MTNSFLPVQNISTNRHKNNYRVQLITLLLQHNDIPNVATVSSLFEDSQITPPHMEIIETTKPSTTLQLNMNLHNVLVLSTSLQQTLCVGYDN